METLKFIIFGDVVARLGRISLTRVLKDLKTEYTPDLVMANVENLAHGFGITEATIDEMKDAGVDIFTSGNHIWSNNNLGEITSNPKNIILRPANYSSSNPGYGHRLVEIKNKSAKVFVINLQGRVFMKDQLDNPFTMINNLLESEDAKNADAILLDFHAEATSEKVAMCWHLDGKVSGVWGTHSHVQTADERMLNQGTACITDVGMTGARDHIIGFEREHAIDGYLKGILAKAPLPETGFAQVNAFYIEVDKSTKHAVKLERIHKELEIR